MSFFGVCSPGHSRNAEVAVAKGVILFIFFLSSSLSSSKYFDYLNFSKIVPSFGFEKRPILICISQLMFIPSFNFPSYFLFKALAGVISYISSQNEL